MDSKYIKGRILLDEPGLESLEHDMIVVQFHDGDPVGGDVVFQLLASHLFSHYRPYAEQRLTHAFHPHIHSFNPHPSSLRSSKSLDR